ncbi:outer membrane lipoprotein-sorting protein [Desulfonema magnum]|uniref:Outer membrane lipoprotein-sorting protein domain-containing protein n=1 Tax=Desulfonema magnum TaxID=45655 RepID=A0A975GPS2_9BACT|nr:outer membrane lipoprotein-sorting protein [Desulfonema magnum]QTA89115.1 Outer membrane lipoprotein-sorting protein domain-containing protein [Desulfonema magnum]
MRKIIIAAFLVLVFFTNGFTEEMQEALTVEDIVRKANHASLYQGADGKGKVTMVITDKQGRTRERAFNMLRKDVGEKDGDQQYFVYFQSPADVRKMVFMVHKHAALEKDDDRWLYMPSLDLVKRIAASDKRTSFVGSDFLYEDISGRNITEDTHELIRTTDEYYVIKNIPKVPDSVEFEYYVAYIDKKTFIPMKIEYFKKDKRCCRIIESKKVENIEAEENGKKVIYPTVIRSSAKDMENGTKSEMTFSNVRYNIGLDDKIFTERYLRRPPRNAMR